MAKQLVCPAGERIRLAVLGGCNLFPLHELVEHFLAIEGAACELFVGEYDNYVQAILEPQSPLYEFGADALFLLPSPGHCQYRGRLTDSREKQESQATALASQLLDLCRIFNQRAGADVVLGNFPLPTAFDLGPYRSRSLGSSWAFRKWVNLQLGLSAPGEVHICDLEFLACRLGAEHSEGPRRWFERRAVHRRPDSVRVRRRSRRNSQSGSRDRSPHW